MLYYIKKKKEKKQIALPIGLNICSMLNIKIIPINRYFRFNIFTGILNTINKF